MLSRLPHKRYDRRRVQNVPFPHNRHIARTDQTARLTFAHKFPVKHFQLRQRITEYSGKHWRTIELINDRLGVTR